MLSVSALSVVSLLGLVRGYGYGPPQQPLLRNIIKVRASGFMPFESDFLLPLGILRQLQATDRASRFIGHRPKSKPQPKPKKPQQVRLERAHPRGGKTQHPGTQMYNLIDDDGELLLNLRVHNEQQQVNPTDRGNLPGSHQAIIPGQHQLEEPSPYDSPWLPSKWRPTTASSLPLGVTSSSPRPLPLHQYLRGSGSSGNRLEQDTAKRRRYDWPHK
ncbi:uncharacterized protein [Drosophila pseudoobscura]|uniref:Uncharacterized protein n=1 Tax=Drosophila pseudoobscura pseudoobscura TaxID=46245 RepID=A0A6I8UH84_DROPS|nr:uncharacterized protein LOC4815598 [Drosophila pseudoobscura]